MPRRIMTLEIAAGLQFLLTALAPLSVLGAMPSDTPNPYRILFCAAENVSIELSTDHYEKVEALSSLGDEPIPWEWVDEHKNDEYAAFFLDTKEIGTVRLNGLVALPSGDGGTAGIAGVVEASPKRLKKCFDFRTIGVAYKVSAARNNARLPQKSRLSHPLRKLLRDMGGHFEGSCYPIPGTPTSIALVTQRISDKRQVVRVFHVNGESVTELGFPESEFRVGKSLLVHDPNGETDVTPRNGELTLLPDFDGNGYPDFIVDGTGADVYSIEDVGSEMPTVTLKRRIYFGP